MRAVAILTSLAFAASRGSPVLAKSRLHRMDATGSYIEDTSPRGFYCVQLCAADMTPCDPAEFKRTDGRCSNPGGFSVN